LIGGLNQSWGGVPVVRSKFLPCKQEWRQVRFPRSKKKRIRKKWAKNKRNFRMVDTEPVMMNVAGTFYVNELGWKALKEMINAPNGPRQPG